MGFEEMQKQGGLDEILKKEAERTGSYEIGMSMTGIDHKELINITDKFTKIGNLNLKEICRQAGSLRAASTFKELTREFSDLEKYIKVFQEGTFKVQELLD